MLFTWALNFGLQKTVGDHLSIDFVYRYLHIASVNTRLFGTSVDGEASKAHGLNLGLTYRF